MAEQLINPTFAPSANFYAPTPTQNLRQIAEGMRAEQAATYDPKAVAEQRQALLESYTGLSKQYAQGVREHWTEYDRLQRELAKQKMSLLATAWSAAASVEGAKASAGATVASAAYGYDAATIDGRMQRVADIDSMLKVDDGTLKKINDLRVVQQQGAPIQGSDIIPLLEGTTGPQRSLIIDTMKKQGIPVDQIANQPIPSNMSSAYGQAANFGQLIYNEQTQASYAERRKLEDEANMYMQSVIDDIDNGHGFANPDMNKRIKEVWGTRPPETYPPPPEWGAPPQVWQKWADEVAPGRYKVTEDGAVIDMQEGKPLEQGFAGLVLTQIDESQLSSVDRRLSPIREEMDYIRSQMRALDAPEDPYARFYQEATRDQAFQEFAQEMAARTGRPMNKATEAIALDQWIKAGNRDIRGIKRDFRQDVFRERLQGLAVDPNADPRIAAVAQRVITQPPALEPRGSAEGIAGAAAEGAAQTAMGAAAPLIPRQTMTGLGGAYQRVLQQQLAAQPLYDEVQFRQGPADVQEEPFSYMQTPADVQQVAPGAESDADMMARAERARARIAAQPEEAPATTREEAIRRMKAQQPSVWDEMEQEAAARTGAR